MVSAYLDCVSAAQVIQEIQHLTPTEQAEVIQFAYRLDAERMLSGNELLTLAKKMVAATDPTEALEIREQMIRGFYGGKTDAWDSPGRDSGPAPAAPFDRVRELEISEE